MKTKIALSMTLTLFVMLSLFLIENVSAQKILVQTGFEEFALDGPPQDWEVKGDELKVTGNTVKSGKKSLAILGGANGDAVGVPVETKDPITSAEFWIYITSGGRSVNFKLTSADKITIDTGGTYIGWNAGAVRACCPWTDMGTFATDTWKYVRIVSDFAKSEFDFYSGDSREGALNSTPQKGLKFREAAFGPAAKRVVFSLWKLASPVFVDDLLVYEGAEPVNLNNPTAVESIGKLATVWGQLKHQ